MIPDFNGHHFEKTLASGQNQRRERYRCARCEMTAEIRNDGVTFFGNGSATSIGLNIPLATSSVPARYRDSYLPRRLLAGFLKITIGYGHRPLLALLWSFVVVLIGWGVIVGANRIGLMRETWPENAPVKSNDRYERLSPFLYSLDVFVPFVNLHQEHYWWPDADARGEVSLFNRRFQISGRALRRYLWLQIIAGWVLSAIFVAGVTGLIRND